MPCLAEQPTHDAPGGTLVPTLLPAQTDTLYLRPAETVTYGFALLSPSLTPDACWSGFHGADEVSAFGEPADVADVADRPGGAGGFDAAQPDRAAATALTGESAGTTTGAPLC